MKLVKSHSNTNYLISWYLGFFAFKIRMVMLISLGTTVRIIKFRTLLVEFDLGSLGDSSPHSGGDPLAKSTQARSDPMPETQPMSTITTW